MDVIKSKYFIVNEDRLNEYINNPKYNDNVEVSECLSVLKEHKEEINNNNFEFLNKEWITLSVVTAILIKADINFLDHMENLADYFFAGMPFINEIIIPDNITSILEACFQDCRYLTKITLPNTIESIEAHAFEDCENLKEIIYRGTKEEWCNIEKVSPFYDDIKDVIIKCNDGDIKINK